MSELIERLKTLANGMKGAAPELAVAMLQAADELAQYEKLPLPVTSSDKMLPKHRILNQDEVDLIFRRGPKRNTSYYVLAQEEIDELLGFDEHKPEKKPKVWGNEDEEALMREWASFDNPRAAVVEWETNLVRPKPPEQEPTMDDIRASIRRILSEDEVEEDRKKDQMASEEPTYSARLEAIEARLSALENHNAVDGPIG